MQKNKIVKTKSIEEIKQSIKDSGTGFDSGYILRQAGKEIGDEAKEFTSDTNYYKAMTLFEFDKGILLLNGLPSLYQYFALEFSKNLQVEYGCKTPSEKSIAEIVSLNFVRTLSIQQRINAYLEMKTINPNGIGYLNVMSKELDRAERHHLTSLEALRTLHSPFFSVNIKTNTAVLGQNQVVQVKNS